MKRLLPEDLVTEAKNYLNSTQEWRDKRAKELGYESRGCYQNAMYVRGIHLLTHPSSSNELHVPLKEKEIILPAPKISLRPPPAQDVREEDEVQIALLSDGQVGLRTKTYNSLVFKKRTLRQYEKICRFADIHRKFCPVKQLNLFMLGDEVEGELVGKQVMLDELEFGVRDQKQLVVQEYTNMVINFLQYYDVVEIDCVAGNHGAMGKQFSQTTNYSLEVFDLLKMALKNYPQVKINVVDDDFYFIRKIKNTRFLGLHGDKIPMYLSLPYYGIDRRALRWKNALPDWDVLCMGHFHSLSFFQSSGIPVFINGTVCSDSRYVAQWLGIKEIAESWTMFVGSKYGITAMHKIDLMKGE